jgi:tRNA-Thr(GGU) m(6)t(6)A37 methyltransferase TsaA
MEILNKEVFDIKNRMQLEKICFKPIGTIHTPYISLKGIPIQFSMSEEEGCIEIYPEYQGGLKDLEGFSHIYCLYFFDMIKTPVPLQSKPFLSNEKKGVFATRTPFRPNPIGISVLRVKKVENDRVYVKNVDILDKTPILDIKPYVTDFDCVKVHTKGWLQGKIKRKTS